MIKKLILLFVLVYACSSNTNDYSKDSTDAGESGEGGVTCNNCFEWSGAGGEFTIDPSGNDAGSGGEYVSDSGSAGYYATIQSQRTYPKLFNVILSGQSNATGFGPMLNSQNWPIDTRVNFNIAGTVFPLEPVYNTTHGLELSLGPLLADLGSNVIIGKGTVPGTACSCWLETGDCWKNTLLKTLLFNKTYGGNYSFVWVQGESDAQVSTTTVDSYASCIKSIIYNVRSVLEDDTVWFYIVLINPLLGFPAVENVREAQLKVLQEDLYSNIVSMDDQVPGLGVHYTSDQELIMGRKVFMEMQYNSVPY